MTLTNNNYNEDVILCGKVLFSPTFEMIVNLSKC